MADSEFEQIWQQVEEAREKDTMDAEDVGKSEEVLRQQYREIAERRRAEKALRDANERLEIRVEERTTELIIANQHLIRELANRERGQEARPSKPLPTGDT